jgi:hypothetical protein
MLAHRDWRGARLAGRGLAVDSETNLQFEVLFCSQNIFLFCEFIGSVLRIRKRTFFWFCKLFLVVLKIVLEISLIFRTIEPKKFRTKKKALGGDPNKRTSRKTNGAGGLVSTNANRREPSELGFFVPGPNCSIKKMFGKILEMEKEAKLPCYDWHAKGLECKRNECKFLHGVFQNFKDSHQTSILDSMLESKCATLNRELLKNKRFKACVNQKYNELWNEPTSNDGQ